MKFVDDDVNDGEQHLVVSWKTCMLLPHWSIMLLRILPSIDKSALTKAYKLCDSGERFACTVCLIFQKKSVKTSIVTTFSFCEDKKVIITLLPFVVY